MAEPDARPRSIDQEHEQGDHSGLLRVGGIQSGRLPCDEVVSEIAIAPLPGALVSTSHTGRESRGSRTMNGNRHNETWRFGLFGGRFV